MKLSWLLVLAAAKLRTAIGTDGSINSQVTTEPDDGFAKVEAKLKALQEKIKADTAKFAAEAKAAPSSLIQQTASIAENMGAAAQAWSLDASQDPMEQMEARFSSIEDQMQ